MRIGIIGAGQIGGTLARRLTAIGHEVAIANDNQKQHPINAMDYALVLPTPPAAHQFQRTAVFPKDRVIDHRCELPAAARCCAHRLDAAPQGGDDVLAQLAQAFEPGAFG